MREIITRRLNPSFTKPDPSRFSRAWGNPRLSKGSEYARVVRMAAYPLLFVAASYAWRREWLHPWGIASLVCFLGLNGLALLHKKARRRAARLEAARKQEGSVVNAGGLSGGCLDDHEG